MEDEIGKHTKEILSVSKEKTGSFKEKTGKIALEIVIIVFSIMVSLWLDNWNDKRKERTEVKEFLADLKEDLQLDTASLNRKIVTLKRYISDYTLILNLTNAQIDSLKKVKKTVNLNFDITPSPFNEGNYQGFKSSGKIGFIDNKDLKKYMLAYYEQVTPSYKEVEKVHLTHQSTLMNTIYEDEFSEKSKKDFFLEPSVKAKVYAGKNFSDLMVKFSEISLQQADSLLLMINRELK